MSYTRSAWKRRYTFGDSHLYSFIGSDGNLWTFGKGCNEDGFDVILKEDAFEFIMGVLRHAKVGLDEAEIGRIAKELGVRLRKKPLTSEERMADMERRHSQRARKRETK